MHIRTYARALLGAAALLAAATPLAAQDARRREPCFTAGRTVDCEFTLRFDAATERFVKIHGRPRGDSLPTDSASMPFDRFTLPVLTGDVVLVEVWNLPHGERIEAGASGTDVTPFPRPGLDETLSLSAITLPSFASISLPRKVDSNLSGTLFVGPDDLRGTRDQFQQGWNVIRDTLAAYSDELNKRVRAITTEGRARLRAQARALDGAASAVAANLDSLAQASDISAARLQAGCSRELDPRRAEDRCLPLLYEASTVAQRQSALVRSLRQVTTTLGLESAVLLADSVGRVLGNRDAATILNNDLEAALHLSRTSADVHTATLGITPDQTVALERLQANLAYAAADSARLRRYHELRMLLLELDTDVRSDLDKVRAASDLLDAARLRLALASNRLVFAFDAAAARPARTFLVPVFRTTSDQEVTVTLTRTPRFATLPQVQLAADPADAKKTDAAPAAPPARTYTEKLRARRRHHFQIIAGFVWSDIRSSRFGVVDATESRDSGNGTTESVTVRRISRTADRPRMFVPAAQLVFHPFGKDVHPDAYRTSSALRPGIAIGTTLDAPVTNFSAGLALEPLPGLHLTGGRLWSQVQDLQEGWEVGAEVPTTTEAAPTRDRFANGWYLGTMLDMGVFAGFFGKLLGGGS